MSKGGVACPVRGGSSIADLGSRYTTRTLQSLDSGLPCLGMTRPDHTCEHSRTRTTPEPDKHAPRCFSLGSPFPGTATNSTDTPLADHLGPSHCRPFLVQCFALGIPPSPPPQVQRPIPRTARPPPPSPTAHLSRDMHASNAPVRCPIIRAQPGLAPPPPTGRLQGLAGHQQDLPKLRVGRRPPAAAGRGCLRYCPTLGS